MYPGQLTERCKDDFANSVLVETVYVGVCRAGSEHSSETLIMTNKLALLLCAAEFLDRKEKGEPLIAVFSLDISLFGRERGRESVHSQLIDWCLCSAIVYSL